MAERRIADLFHCSEETYWSKLFFDEAYNKTLFLEELRFESWMIVHSEENDRQILRTVEAVPRVGNLPMPVKKLIKNGAGYREESVFDKQTRRCTATAIPRSLPDRLRIRGVTSTEPVAEGRCNRVFTVSVKAEVFAVGGMLETLILDDLQKIYAKAARFSNRWIADRGL
jgi:hypothetical protein